MDDEEKRARKRAADKRYREQDPERKRALARAREKRWRERHPDKVRERARKYYAANRETILEKGRGTGRERYRKDPSAALAITMLSHHGLRPEEWAAIWQAQDGRCYLGGEPLDELGPKFVHIDHDHSCCRRWNSCPTCRRGLACHNCNTLIGLAGDDPDRLRRIADALEAAQAAVEGRKAAMSEQQLILDIG